MGLNHSKYLTLLSHGANAEVIIVGAGPSGLLMGVLLAKENIEVTLLDMGNALDTNPRATHYATPAVMELRRAGVLDDVRAQGFTPDGVCWRKIDGTWLAGINMGVVKDDPNTMACLPLNRLGQVFMDHIVKYPSAKVLWSHEVIGIEQDEHAARVKVKTPEGEKTFEADYVVGCDGANSKVRRSLFGDWEFPGKTWDEQIVATNVYYPFEKFDYIDSNFIIHPEHWYMAARITTDGMWRVSYGELAGLTRDEVQNPLSSWSDHTVNLSSTVQI